MSQENVEIVRRSVAAFNRGDLDGALEEWAPDAIWDWTNSRGFDAASFAGTTRSGRTGSACSTHSTRFGSTSLTR
jgi:ketosteroid isomerase-like protein